MIGESIGNHKIVAKLGQGGMGTVYQAEDTTLGRKVAIKILNPALLLQGGKEMERFQSEAKLQASLNHPNIVVLHNFEPYGSSYYMVMEYVEGKTLAEIVRNSGPLPSHISVVIAKQVLDGLSAAHRKGIVHRDLKPSNIMITPEGVAKVMDFGIAKVQGGKSLTATGALVGTVYYMSPEQVRGETVDSRSDLYSFGIILFEMLTGRVPFKEESDFKIMIHHVQTPPPLPTQLLPAIPSPLEDIVLRALSKEPDKRFQAADEILTALEAFEEQERAFGRGQLYTRRALSQWMTNPAESGAAPIAEPAGVLASQTPATPGFVPPSSQSPDRILPAGSGVSVAESGPEPARAWTITPPIAPELRAQLAAQGTPAPASRGLFFVIALLAVVMFLGGASYYLLKVRNQTPLSAKTESQQTQVPAQAAAGVTGQTDPNATASQAKTAPSVEQTSPAASQSPSGANASTPAQPDATTGSLPAKTSSEAMADLQTPGQRQAPAGAGGELGSRQSASPAIPMTRSDSAPAAMEKSTTTRSAAKTSTVAIPRDAKAAKSGASGAASSEPAGKATQKLPQGILIFFDLDQGSERLPLGTAQARVADVVREAGLMVVSSGVVSSNVRSALDRRDLAEVRRNGVGYVIMGTAHGSLEAQNAYGSTYSVARVDVNFELVRMSDGGIAVTGGGSAKSRGSANAGAALNEALMTATSEAARNLMREFRP